MKSCFGFVSKHCASSKILTSAVAQLVFRVLPSPRKAEHQSARSSNRNQRALFLLVVSPTPKIRTTRDARPVASLCARPLCVGFFFFLLGRARAQTVVGGESFFFFGRTGKRDEVFFLGEIVFVYSFCVCTNQAIGEYVMETIQSKIKHTP